MERTVTVTLSDEDAAYLDSRIGGENGYADESAFVRESVKRMKADEDWLRAEIQKGEDDFAAGRYTTYDSASDLAAELKQRLRDRAR